MPEFIEYCLDCGFLLDHVDDKLTGVDHAVGLLPGSVPNGNTKHFRIQHILFIYCWISSILIGPALTQNNHSKHQAHADLSWSSRTSSRSWLSVLDSCSSSPLEPKAAIMLLPLSVMIVRIFFFPDTLFCCTLLHEWRWSEQCVRELVALCSGVYILLYCLLSFASMHWLQERTLWDPFCSKYLSQCLFCVLWTVFVWTYPFVWVDFVHDVWNPLLFGTVSFQSIFSIILTKSSSTFAFHCPWRECCSDNRQYYGSLFGTLILIFSFVFGVPTKISLSSFLAGWLVGDGRSRFSLNLESKYNVRTHAQDNTGNPAIELYKNCICKN